MVSEMVRQESWINEVLRINSCTGGITEVKFGYSQLCAIRKPTFGKGDRKFMKLLPTM